MKSDFRSWSEVRIFLAVVRNGSTLAASQKLGIAQPTVARRVEALEQETGLTLFERDTRGFRPTEAARNLYPLAEEIEAAVKKFAAKTIGLTDRQPIRITAPGTFSDRAMDILSEFIALHPGTAFEFIPSVKTLNLIEGEADIAVRIAKREPDANLICRTISTARWALFGGHSYAEIFGLPSSPSKLKGHRFVTFKHDDVPEYLHNWLLRFVSPDQIVASFNEVELMQASVRAGHGLGLLNLRLAGPDAGLVQCFDQIEELSRSNMLLIAPEAYRRPEIKAFAKFFAPRYAKLLKSPK
jgi:DNA-binding transcriptional LysR family regulator